MILKMKTFCLVLLPLCLSWAFCQQSVVPNDLQSSKLIIQARVTRQVMVLEPLFKNPATPSETMRQAIQSVGQIGDPRGLVFILPLLERDQYRDEVLFAIGECHFSAKLPDSTRSILEGLAALHPSGDTALLWFETFSKLLNPSSESNQEWLDLIWARWENLADNEKGESLFKLWRLKDPRITAWVLKQVDEGSSSPGMVYYLYRTKTTLSKNQFLALLDIHSNQPGNLVKLLMCKVESGTKSGLVTSAGPPLPLFLFNHPDWRVRVEALKATYRMGLPDLVGENFLADPNPNVRNTFLEQVLAKRGMDKALQKTLVRNWKTMSPDEKWTVMKTLPKIESRWLELDASLWKNSPSVWLRHKSIQALAKIDNPENLAYLDSLFYNGSSVEKVLAANILVEREPSYLKKVLESKDPFLFAIGIDSIGTPGTPSPKDFTQLIQTLKEERDVQYFSLKGLREKLEAEGNGELFQSLLLSPYYLVRLKAAEALGLDDFTPVFSKPWESGCPEEVLQLATEFLKHSDPVYWDIETEKGHVMIELSPQLAPVTCASMVTLATHGYFDRMPIHRVVSDFVVQAGDPRGDGSGGPGYNIPCEINRQSYARGSVGMALAGKDTGGSQFFICHSNQPHLDGGYTIFGEVRFGMSIVDILHEGNMIVKTTIKDNL